MKKIIFIIILFISNNLIFSQEKDSIKLSTDKLLKELSDNACKCIDSILVQNKSREQIVEEISRCINNQTTAYQMGSKLINAANSSLNEKKNVTIEIASDENSNEYKKYFFEIERYLMQNCKTIKEKIISDNKKSFNSVSENDKAIEQYNLGQKYFEKKDYKNALKYYKKAVKIDDNFAFTWDNIGLTYRYLGEYDNAISAYEKSIEINPYGKFPLQNIAIAYSYNKQFDKAVLAYEKLSKLDNENPEVYYGIGLVCYLHTKEFEKSLQNMCNAYNLYVAQKSPYRTDAEKVISLLYTEFQKEGKEDRFNEILKEYNLNPQK